MTVDALKRRDVDTAPCDGGEEMIGRLNRSFETFIGITEDLKRAYDGLRERAEAMDLELKDTNERLAAKVRELDGLTRRLDDLLQSMPSAVTAVDRKGIVTHFNRAAESMLGLRRDAVVGRALESIPALDNLLLLGRGKDPVGAGEERRIRTPDGRSLVVASRVASLADGRIEMLTDLTETDRLRREVHRLDTLAAMGEMAAAVAHQVRNPLNGVEGFASLLERKLRHQGGGEGDDLRYASRIVAGVREVNAIITGMLMLARSDRVEAKPVDLNRIAGEVARTVQAAAEEKGEDAEIVLLPAPGGLFVNGDGLKLKQALLNVVHNALEALPRDGRRAIRIRLSDSKGRARIRVADSGRGMSREEASKVLRPFFTTKDSGIGLGLSVTAKIVDLHGGTLALRSVPGVGTVFKIDLKSRPKPAGKESRNDGACARCG